MRDVGSRREVWWTWVALDAETQRVVAMAAGDRYESTARCLWQSLPDDYRAGAVVFSDLWAAYAAVIPEEQHFACGKGCGMTCHVERSRRSGSPRRRRPPRRRCK
jgi:IS1 family transposase